MEPDALSSWSSFFLSGFENCVFAFVLLRTKQKGKSQILCVGRREKKKKEKTEENTNKKSLN